MRPKTRRRRGTAPARSYDVTPASALLRKHSDTMFEEISKEAQPEDRLMAVLKGGNVAKVREYLDAGLFPDIWISGKPIIQIAYESGQREIVALIQERLNNRKDE